MIPRNGAKREYSKGNVHHAGWVGDRPCTVPAGSVTDPADCPKEALRFRRGDPSTSRLPGPTDGSHSAAYRSYDITLATLLQNYFTRGEAEMTDLYWNYLNGSTTH